MWQVKMCLFRPTMRRTVVEEPLALRERFSKLLGTEENGSHTDYPHPVCVEKPSCLLANQCTLVWTLWYWRLAPVRSCGALGETTRNRGDNDRKLQISTNELKRS
jgi:hypothetical protein